MIHWTYAAIKPCLAVMVQFFWGEAEWGATQSLRQLRKLRLSIILLSMLSISLVCWAIVERALAVSNDTYSYYEGKILEERITETKRKVDEQSNDIKRLLEMANTSTLLAVRMQAQMEAQQQVIDAGIKIFGAAVIMPTLAMLWAIFRSGLRRERYCLHEHTKDSVDKENL